MTFTGFTEEDFNVFTVPGLEARMEALKSTVRPKLEAIGAHFAPILSAETGDEMFYHVAKHARRTVHPPQDTWVAWAGSKRGYKMLPHFQVGLWETHLFIWFAIIYESPAKQHFAGNLAIHWNRLKEDVPQQFVWSYDHTKPDVFSQKDMSDAKMQEMIDRLKHIKKAEILCGLTLDRNDRAVKDGELLLDTIDKTFAAVLPLYKLAR
ncbi:DUF1054 domain-containing protein [Aneurinibacillus sp. Ricciae_BoGa-3]|uniref:YktB family protein n=1 Tax=Aneurinibacillus sp. Ricciae_BoGa-3 TaxID=3022697 RepID=UPI002341FAA4|nr:DUF1054 domain-containing protein [Aneurinibacillus sp. Ricciae_BoGa-3]WCK53118.1 DUF1054 domain-containing protein [Aneurinibacillus sp. Ricciae_BoGa-3]